MTRVALFVCCLAVLCVPAASAAQEARDMADAKAAASVDAVLEKYVKAVGGRAAWDKIESLRVKADLEAAGSTAEWSMDAKAPDKRVSRVDVPGFGPYAEGFDGETAWVKTQNGADSRQGDELARAKREAAFRREVRLKELYPNLESKGTETFNGEEVRVLESKPSATSKERFSFSAKNGLLVRQQSDFQNKDGNQITVETEFADYRDVGGVKYPYLQKFKILADGQQLLDFVLKVKEVKHNEKIDDSVFKRPE